MCGTTISQMSTLSQRLCNHLQGSAREVLLLVLDTYYSYEYTAFWWQWFPPFVLGLVTGMEFLIKGQGMDHSSFIGMSKFPHGKFHVDVLSILVGDTTAVCQPWRHEAQPESTLREVPGEPRLAALGESAPWRPPRTCGLAV